VNQGTSPVNTFIFTLTTEQNQHLSLFEATTDTGARLSVGSASNPKRTPAGFSYVERNITLDRSLASEESITLRILLIFTHTLIPFPAQITQDEPQLVRYVDNHFFFSPYHSSSQETRIRLSSPKIESFTPREPSLVKGESIRYGPYLDVLPYSVSEMVLHFENNSPFVTIRSLVREFEISHWGNLAVEETYSLEHTGAKFTGAFSRFDYQRQGAPSSYHILTHHLPAEAQDIYYRDEIGNVSSSFVSHPKEDYTKLEILPRYIMFGGWKISFYMGYNLPLSKYLSYDANHPSRYILNVTFAKTFEEPVSIDEIVVRIIFPEGASDIQYRVPFDVDSQDHDKHFTYLDTVGRPVLILKKSNVVGAHNQYFQVTYSFSKFTMLREPFLLITAFFIFFLIVMIYVRLDLSITPETVGIESSKQKQLRDCLQRVNEIQKAREEIYAELDSTAARSKAKKSCAIRFRKKDTRRSPEELICYQP